MRRLAGRVRLRVQLLRFEGLSNLALFGLLQMCVNEREWPYDLGLELLITTVHNGLTCVPSQITFRIHCQLLRVTRQVSATAWANCPQNPPYQHRRAVDTATLATISAVIVRVRVDAADGTSQ